MATFTITQTGSTQEQAEGAALGIVSDILSIDGVGEPNIVVEENGRTFLAVLTIIIPDDIELDDVQREKLSRYTDLDDKSAELENDFEKAEEDGAPKDMVAEAVSDQAREEMRNPDSSDSIALTQEHLPQNDSEKENKIIVEEDNIGAMIPEPAPEAADEFGAGLTAEAVTERESRQDKKENKAANSPEEPSNKNNKPKPDENLEPAA